MNGAKSRVEKLCQAFENGKDLVELSDHSPHDVSNVLKLYLRQVSLESDCSNNEKQVVFFFLNLDKDVAFCCNLSHHANKITH